MPANILIIHAEDAQKEADWLKAQLQNQNIDSWTFAEAMKIAPLGGFIIIYHGELVEKSQKIVVIASPKLFKNGFLAHIAEMAIFSKKFIPVLIGHEGTKLDSWFKVPDPIILSRKEGTTSDFWQKFIKTLK